MTDLERFKSIFSGLDIAYGQTKRQTSLMNVVSIKLDHLLLRNNQAINYGEII